MTPPTPEALATACADLRAGKPLADVAAALGVSRNRLTYVCTRDAALGAAYEAGKTTRAEAQRAAANAKAQRLARVGAPACDGETPDEDDGPRREPTPHTSPARVADAITAAASAARAELGAGRLQKASPWSEFRKAFHSLSDDIRRATLAQLLLEEDERIDVDRQASFQPRPRRHNDTLVPGGGIALHHVPIEQERGGGA